jgi:hypothetical protein
MEETERERKVTWGATRARRNAAEKREELRARARSTSRNSACSASTARDTSGWNASDVDEHALAHGRRTVRLPRLARGRAKGEEVRVVAAAVDIAAGDSNPHTDSDRLVLAHCYPRRLLRRFSVCLTVFQHSPARPVQHSPPRPGPT